LYRKVVPRGYIRVIDGAGTVDRYYDDNGKRTVIDIRSVEHLESVLETLRPNATICGVSMDRLRKGAPRDWHAVVIRNYDPSTKTVYLDNSWGSKEEHSGEEGQRERLASKKLYKIMRAGKSEK